MVKRRRTLIKTFTFRISATILTMILVYLFTNDLAITGTVGTLEFFSKLALYYVHERLWNKVSWGKRQY